MLGMRTLTVKSFASGLEITFGFYVSRRIINDVLLVNLNNQALTTNFAAVLAKSYVLLRSDHFNHVVNHFARPE